MSVVYRKVEKDNTSRISSKLDDDEKRYDLWSGLLDRQREKIFENDIVECAGRVYVVKRYKEEWCIFALEKYADDKWYDYMPLTSRVARKTLIREMVSWEAARQSGRKG